MKRKGPKGHLSFEQMKGVHNHVESNEDVENELMSCFLKQETAIRVK